MRPPRLPRLALVALAAAAGCDSSPKPTVDLYVMSKCPFGSHLASELAPALTPLTNHIQLNIAHLGQLEGETLASLRGEDELQGDLLQTCAGIHGSTAGALKFLACQAERFESIPAGWDECAQAAGLDPSALRTCTEDGEGLRTLKASFEKAKKLGVEQSPTLLLNGKAYEGARNRFALARAVCSEMGDRARSECATLPQPAPVDITVVTDSRCGDECGLGPFRELVEREVPGGRIQTLDWSTEEGRAAHARSGRRHLPVALFPGDWKPGRFTGRQFAPHLKPTADGKQLSFAIGQRFNPLAEVCDNAVDDDGDGQLDCADADCTYRPGCRQERPNTLTVHLLLGDTFGIRGVEAAHVVMKNTPFEVQVLPMGKTADRGLVATGGGESVIEGKRLLCAQAHGLQGMAVLEYAACRYQRQGDPNWQGCLAAGVERPPVETCAEGDEGLRLLTLAYRNAEQLGISRSPQVVVNDVHVLPSYAPDAIREGLCKHNPGRDGCTAQKAKVQ